MGAERGAGPETDRPVETERGSEPARVSDGTGVVDRQRVFEELFRRLAARGVRHPDRAAAHALRHERGARTVVGLTAADGRLVRHDRRARTLRAVPVDAHGVHEPGAETLARDLGAPGAWAQRHRDRLGWVHPRYRTDEAGVERDRRS